MIYFGIAARGTECHAWSPYKHNTPSYFYYTTDDSKAGKFRSNLDVLNSSKCSGRLYFDKMFLKFHKK